MEPQLLTETSKSEVIMNNNNNYQDKAIEIKLDNNTENSHLLKTVLLSCSYKIYVQNITQNEKK